MPFRVNYGSFRGDLGTYTFRETDIEHLFVLAQVRVLLGWWVHAKLFSLANSQNGTWKNGKPVV